MQDKKIRATVRTLYDEYLKDSLKAVRRQRWTGVALAILLTPVFIVLLHAAFRPGQTTIIVLFVMGGYAIYRIPERIGRRRQRERSARAARRFERHFPKDGALYSRALQQLDGLAPGAPSALAMMLRDDDGVDRRLVALHRDLLEALDATVLFEDERAAAGARPA